MSLCYPLMWNVTLEYKTTHFNVVGLTKARNNFPNVPHTASVRSSVESVPYPSGLEPETSSVRIHYAIRSPTAASRVRNRHFRSRGAISIS